MSVARLYVPCYLAQELFSNVTLQHTQHPGMSLALRYLNVSVCMCVFKHVSPFHRFLKLDDLESFLEDAERAAGEDDDKESQDDADRLGHGAHYSSSCCFSSCSALKHAWHLTISDLEYACAYTEGSWTPGCMQSFCSGSLLSCCIYYIVHSLCCMM